MTAPLTLVLLGRPGAGKGTQGARLADHFGIAHLSTGDALRRAVREGTALGKEVAAAMREGELVPDEVIVGVVDAVLASAAGHRKGFLLDGFPRTIAQAEAFFAARGEHCIEAALELDVPAELVVERMSGRRVCESCGAITFAPTSEPSVPCGECDGWAETRPDDAPEAIRHRLAVYDAQTGPLSGWFAARNLLVSVDGRGAADEVFESAVRALRPTIWGEGMAVG